MAVRAGRTTVPARSRMCTRSPGIRGPRSRVRGGRRWGRLQRRRRRELAARQRRPRSQLHVVGHGRPGRPGLLVPLGEHRALRPLASEFSPAAARAARDRALRLASRQTRAQRHSGQHRDFRWLVVRQIRLSATSFLRYPRPAARRLRMRNVVGADQGTRGRRSSVTTQRARRLGVQTRDLQNGQGFRVCCV
jgi:hypothetical protein